MNKSKKIVVGFFITSVIILGVLLFFYVQKQNEVILFYGDGCPHCEIVENFIDNNKINEKVTIIRLEIWNNTENRQKLETVIKICKMNQNETGIPLAYTGGKCYMGDSPVINMLKIKSGVDSKI